MTRILRAYPDELETQSVREGIALAGRILKEGGLVAFPTETVYGLGANALDADACRRIYAAKGRPSDNPLIVHIADIADLERAAVRIPASARMLAEKFWPGPLTIILHRNADIPDATTGSLPTVAVRFPSHPTAMAMIRAGGGLIAAPSANRSGRPSPTKAAHCIEDLDGRVDMIIDGGEVGIGLESSIIDLTEEIPVLLRPGYVTVPMLREVLGNVEVDQAILGSDARPKAPGMKYRHYAPRGQMVMVEGDERAVAAYINERAGAFSTAGKKTAVLCAAQSAGWYDREHLRVYCLGSREDPEQIAANLFGTLRQCDTDGMEEIFTESFSVGDLSGAIMNRLEKACGHRKIRIPEDGIVDDTGRSERNEDSIGE